MEKDFGTNKPVRVALHPSSGNQLAIGFIDGSIRFCSFDLPESKIEVKIACIFFSAKSAIVCGERYIKVKLNEQG